MIHINKSRGGAGEEQGRSRGGAGEEQGRSRGGAGEEQGGAGSSRRAECYLFPLSPLMLYEAGWYGNHLDLFF